MKDNIPLTLTVICLLGSAPGVAAPPAVQTPGPVIFLADNLDEADQLGWCIDTVGRGFAEQLHAHSCKPRGGDVQFGYNNESQQIYSVAFDGKCMTLNRTETPAQFDLKDCDSNNPDQQFEFTQDSGAIKPASDSSLCVAVGASSRSAGPFMSRDLTLADCSSIDVSFKQWQQK